MLLRKEKKNIDLIRNALPKNWMECTLKDIGDIYSGGTPSTIHPNNFNGDIPWLTPADLSNYSDKTIAGGRRNISAKGFSNSSAKLLCKGAILFSSRAPIGYVVIASNSITTNQGFKNIELSKYVFNEYVYYYLKSAKNLAIKHSSGTTFQEISGTAFANLPIPIASFKEQQRIVAKIEKLFKDIDDSISQLKTASNNLELYKEAILYNVFANNKLKTVRIGDVCDVVRGGSPRPAGDPKFYGGNIPFLKVADITKDNKKFLNIHTFTIKEAGLKKTRKVQKNTLLLSNSGATLGVPKICTFTTTFNDGIAAFLNLPEESLSFHYYFWLSKTKELRNINQGAAQPNLNTDLIKEMRIPSLSISEQKSIVKEIEKQFAVADELQKTVDTALQNAAKLKQSILKKAFEGRLVPQDPKDEPASVLLERIKSERQTQEQNKKSKTIIKPKRKNK